MDWEALGLLSLICLLIIVAIVEIFVVILIAGAVASLLGFTGALWWLVAVVVFILLNSLIGAIWSMR